MRAPGTRVAMRARATDLPRWSRSCAPPPTPYPDAADPIHPHVVFPHDDAVNGRLALWQGDIASLEVDVIVNSTNESMNENNPVSERIFAVAGPDLKEEIFLEGKECRTGDVCVTSAYNLSARHIIHAVGPKYTPKYRTAAENSLHNCYRNVLYKSQELGARSLAICLLHSLKKNFPPDLGAHIALRTIRRYLERHTSPIIVLACLEGADYALLETLCPLYFPRSGAEAEAARSRLPADAGGGAGEPVTCAHRTIRIIHNPHQSNNNQTDDDASISEYAEEDAAAEAAAALARVQLSPDTQRLLATPAVYPPLHDVMRRTIQQQERYDRLLRRARSEDLTEVSGIGCLYRSGVDRLGRPVVVFIGKWFPINDINLDKALLYLIQLLDPVVQGDYVIAYFHTQASVTNHPPFSWLKEVYTVLPYKYKKNLKAFYIVHPTFWTKMMTWWFTTFMAPAIKAKVHNLPGVEYLYAVMARDQLEIPAFVTEYDMTINGLHYFQPEANST